MQIETECEAKKQIEKQRDQQKSHQNRSMNHRKTYMCVSVVSQKERRRKKTTNGLDSITILQCFFLCSFRLILAVCFFFVRAHLKRSRPPVLSALAYTHSIHSTETNYFNSTFSCLAWREYISQKQSA